jgi:hypothetical protein
MHLYKTSLPGNLSICNKKKILVAENEARLPKSPYIQGKWVKYQTLPALSSVP